MNHVDKMYSFLPVTSTTSLLTGHCEFAAKMSPADLNRRYASGMNTVLQSVAYLLSILLKSGHYINVEIYQCSIKWSSLEISCRKCPSG